MKASKIIIWFISAIIVVGVYSYETSMHDVILSKVLERKSPEEVFDIWIYLFEKKYKSGSEEYNRRLVTFKEKLQKVNKHNRDPSKSWKMTLDKWADLSKAEFRQIFSHDLNSENMQDIMKKIGESFPSNGFFILDPQFPTAAMNNPIDWSSTLGPVNDQASCGSCYAFSMINAIEGNYNIATKTENFFGIGQSKLSRQEIVDCNPLTGGCNGGNPTYVAVYAHSRGMMLDSAYGQYIAKNQTCKSSGGNPNYVNGAESMIGSDKSIYNSLAAYDMLTRGPAVVVLDADALDSYSNGVINLTGCLSANHAVLLVGYGLDPIAGAYWLIKNSWGTWWGEKGYFRVLIKDDTKWNCFIQKSLVRPFFSVPAI